MPTKVPATQLSLKHLRNHELGFTLVEVVEKRQIVHGQKFSITQDLFGIIDIIALGPVRTLRHPIDPDTGANTAAPAA